MALTNQNNAANPASFPLLRVFAPYAALTHYKGYFIGECPICSGTPARMVVRPDQGAWHCYHCGAGGDAIDFLQAVEQLSRDQAYLLYKVLIRDESRKPTPVPRAPAANNGAPPPPPPPVELPPEPPREPAITEPPKPAAEPGTLAELRARLVAAEGFRGIACFDGDGKALLVDGVNADEVAPIDAYFDAAFRMAEATLGASDEPSAEGVLHDDAVKFMRLDAPGCRIFLALHAGASEARFRMVVRNFLKVAKKPLQ